MEIPDVSLYDFLFADLTGADLDRVALIDGPSGDKTTYGTLRAHVDAVAGAIAARGLEPGDVVALHSPNVPAFVSVFHGLLRAGVTVTTVNALASGAEVGKQLIASGAKALITVSPLLAQATAGAEAAGLGAAPRGGRDGAPGPPPRGGPRPRGGGGRRARAPTTSSCSTARRGTRTCGTC
ncbi:AMP-binding protein [Isoptericola sp. G70]|uniref:AMP-binding protein n=1 Tax=Isoptericola sp. G70 TaxID=3376633 RepID=UPI003A80855C